MTDPDTDPKPDPGPFIPPVPASATKAGVLLPVAAIDANGRVRAVNPAAVAQMADSIEAKGLITPITVRPVSDTAYRLVLGGHRLAAVALLGWGEVRCDVRELDDDAALALELDENLARHELDALDFGLFCRERKALDERVAERAGHGGARRGSSRQVGDLNAPRFTAEMAERIGKGERTIQRAIAVVDALDPETVALVRGTPVAANASQLADLGREKNLAKRRHLAEQLLGGARTVAAARVALGDAEPPAENPQAVALLRLHEAWKAADPDTRAAFLRDVDAAYTAVPPQAAFAAGPAPGPAPIPPQEAKPARRGAKAVH